MIQLENESLSIRNGADLLLRHSPESPFAVAIRREKDYRMAYGSAKETVRETARIPLTDLHQEGGALLFTGNGHVLTARLKECEKGAELELEGEPGWSYAFSLPAEAGEAVFGGGEQYRKTDLRGETVVNFVSEHIKPKTLIEKALLPRKLYREKGHSDIGSYAPMPVFVTDRGRIIRFETDADGVADFSGDPYVFTYDSCPRKLLLLKAESYREAAALLNQRTPNRQYLPDWCHDGMILGAQGGTEAVLTKTFRLLGEGAKICAVWCQDWSGEIRTVAGKQVWWNWEADQELYPGLREAIARLNAAGVRFLAYINPYLVKDSRLYTLCRENGWLIRNKEGDVYHIKSTTFDAGMLDLTNPEAVRFIKDVLIRQNMLDLGISGWMADFGEYLPVDCVLHDGDPAKLHNRWPVLWAKINREAIEESGAEDIMFFTRSGYLGIQSYAPVMWNGDQHTDTTRDYGLPCVMPASFSLGFSGVTMVHCDIGGFFSIGKLHRSDELFIRWMEMCCFSLLMRSHESIRPWANSQPYSENVVPYTVRLTGIHAALKPYIAHCVEEARKGVPQMRPDFWEAMDHSVSKDMYSYFLGDDLFVCPVIEENVRSREVFLPEGQWVAFWSGETLQGGKSCTVKTELGYPPVFYRKESSFAELFRKTAEEYK